jgi:hypothetical protein
MLVGSTQLLRYSSGIVYWTTPFQVHNFSTSIFLLMLILFWGDVYIESEIHKFRTGLVFWRDVLQPTSNKTLRK